MEMAETPHERPLSIPPFQGTPGASREVLPLWPALEAVSPISLAHEAQAGVCADQPPGLLFDQEGVIQGLQPASVCHGLDLYGFSLFQGHLCAPIGIYQ